MRAEVVLQAWIALLYLRMVPSFPGLLQLRCFAVTYCSNTLENRIFYQLHNFTDTHSFQVQMGRLDAM